MSSPDELNLSHRASRVAVVDFGMGNLYSVKRACLHVGLDAIVTASGKEILEADAVILPGIGAFGDAMETLKGLGLVSILQETARSSKPLLGICLGMQLFMSRSFEFGEHEGLGIVPGTVERLSESRTENRRLKVPQVGWNMILKPATPSPGGPWNDGPLAGIDPETYMYFVHSYYVRPADPGAVLCMSRYGSMDFCSGLNSGNLTGFQFHPERSGPRGLGILRNFARLIAKDAVEHC